MKKVLQSCLALLIAVRLLLPMSAAGAGSLTVSHVSGRQGETAVVEVRLDNGDICGGRFVLNYAGDELELISADKAGSYPGFVNPKPEKNQILVSLASTSVLESQALLTLTFRILADTSAEGSAITVSEARFYGEDNQSTAATITAGSVTRDCAWLRLDSAETVAGQAARVEVSLSGGLLPAGGQFSILYDASVVKPTAVLPMEAAENTAVVSNLSVPGKVMVSFAGTENLENGCLCAVIFTAVGAAESGTELALADICLRDAEEQILDHAVTVGSVSIVVPQESDPKLWVVGGAIESDGGATVSVVLQGRGKVCGGQFSLSFDPAMDAEVIAGEDVTAKAENGTVKLSWAGVAPETDTRTLLTVRFSSPVEGKPISFGSDVRLYDGSDNWITSVDIRPAVITASSVVTAVVDEVKVESSSGRSEVTVDVDLADINFYTAEQTERVVPMLALYEGSRMTALVKADSIALSDGIAETSLSVSTGRTFDSCRVFLLSDDTGALPLCSALQPELS